MAETLTVDPTPEVKLTAKDFQTDQDVRWCPGCGDYSILKQVHTVLPQLGIPKEDIVFISGIGCSSRFPYYTNTYGFHTIHRRAAAPGTRLKMARRGPPGAGWRDRTSRSSSSPATATGSASGATISSTCCGGTWK